MRKGGETVFIKIHNPNGNNDCLSLPNDCWQRAIKDEQLTRAELALYFFLASHSDNESIDLNRKLFEEATGYKKTVYNSAILTLKAKGYLIKKWENQYDFHIAPLRVDGQIPNFIFSEE